MHCYLATGGPGAATRHAPFGRPRRPLGTFPRGESTSSARRRAKPPTRNRFLVEGRKRAYLFFLHHKGFRLCGGDQGAFRSPPGPLRGPFLYAWVKSSTRNRFLVEGRKRAYLSFPASQRVSPLRRRPKGFPIALWKPSAPCCNANRNLHKKQFPCKKQKTGLPQSPPINANSHGGHSFHRGHIVFITFSPEQRSPVPAPPGPESPGQYQIHIPPGPAARASRNRCLPRKRPPHHCRRRNRPCTGCPCIR